MHGSYCIAAFAPWLCNAKYGPIVDLNVFDSNLETHMPHATDHGSHTHDVHASPSFPVACQTPLHDCHRMFWAITVC